MAWGHNPVGWFEIPVQDMARAKEFYEYLFGVDLEEHDMQGFQMAWFPMVEGSMGAAGTLVKGEGYEPSAKGVLVYFTAPGLEEHMARAGEKGGKVLIPRTDIGEFGVFAVIQDPEGNRIGLHTRE